LWWRCDALIIRSPGRLDRVVLPDMAGTLQLTSS
jgi:hypothetical protein